MERTTKQFTISLPPDMAEQVVAAAKAESRTISELFREAFRTYRAQRIQTLLKTVGRGRPAPKTPGLHSGRR
jgi:metal-responsive CopG/Arc/MetJ family transcriptional regulator